MFCRQCEQTGGGKGCTVQGVCGKTNDTAILQDLLIFALKGLGFYGDKARTWGVKDAAIDLFVAEALFATVTNVDFDPVEIQKLILKAYEHKETLKKLFQEAYREENGKEFNETVPDAAKFKPLDSLPGLIAQGEGVGILSGAGLDGDIRSLRELLLYGMKGMAAYADHAAILGAGDEEVYAFFYKGLTALDDDSLSAKALTALVLEFGKVNFTCLKVLDGAHVQHLGNPVPTKVSLGVKSGPAIVISGHDLLDLKQLLEQTEGSGVSVYTHGEMLSAHGYPALNKYKHLAGHYGTAWQNQQKEFSELPGAILMTTNCIQKPSNSYKDKMFTTGLVRWPDVAHIEAKGGKKDFSRLIAKAKELGGVKEGRPGKNILVGFAHKAVLGAAPQIIEAVKGGKIKHFFLIGGCDGAKPGRNYYTEFAQKVPQDCVVLTLACGKFRFNTLEFGDIGGIPRLLDCGQCNDAYSAIVIAVALAEAFKCTVNDLPLSLVLSWYEQKAVCILITLLSLGIKNVRLGPSLPVFVSPGVLEILVKNFNIKPIANPEQDLKDILGRSAAPA